MKRKLLSKKTLIFLMVHFTLTAYMFFIIFFSPDTLPVMGNYIIGSQIFNAGIAMGGRVADDFQRSIYYKSELSQESDE